MLLLLLCILLSTVIGVIFKYFVRYRIDSFQAIVFNYLTCLVLGSILEMRLPFHAESVSSPWFLYALIVGCFFITGFNIMAITVRYFGITLTTVMQKMSLVLSAGFAILIYHESAAAIKIIGILFSIPAILLINRKSQMYVEKKRKLIFYAIFPVLTFLISGILEILFYVVKEDGLSSSSDLAFTTHAFSIAAIIGLILLIYWYLTGRKQFHKKHLIAGIILGIPNFFAVYLILTLLHIGYDGSVLFPVLNIGILVLSAMAGVIIFLEKLRTPNVIGLILALVSILLISQS